MKPDVYQIVTEQIKTLLEQNETPWTKPWVSRSIGQQKNLVSNRPYTGLNALLLSLNDFETDYWLTFKQADELGLKIRKGEKSTIIIGWFKSESEVETDDGETEIISHGLRARYFRVFNVSQLETIPDEIKAKVARRDNIPLFEHEPNEIAETLIQKQNASIHFGSEAAFYRVKQDTIHMPDRNRFSKLCEFYSTIFHEIGHWTGHETRLNRRELVKGTLFNSKSYSQEELVAEMTSVFVCSSLNISNDSTIRNSAAYIKGWLKFLKENSKAFVIACQQGQKAADFILSKGDQ